MTTEELKVALAAHDKWIRNDGGSYADLTNANLTNADLTNANLTNAVLRGAVLTGANLRGTVLDQQAPMPTTFTDGEIAYAGLIAEGDRIYGWRTVESSHCGSTRYEVGQCYEAPVFSVCKKTECHPGIYLAGRKWLMNTYGNNVQVVRCYCMRSELIHVGDKWRCKRLWVVADDEEMTK